MVDLDRIVLNNLQTVFSEMKVQQGVRGHYPEDGLSFDEEMAQLREYIEDAGEYGVAYEAIVANLEEVPFRLSGKATVALLEVGLVMGFKTERPQDSSFDRRNEAV